MQLPRQLFQMTPPCWICHKYPRILEILLNDQNSLYWTGSWNTLQNPLLCLFAAW